jgi:hypothetical protein
MRSVAISILLLIPASIFGQKNIKKALILVDGKATTYKEYKALDLTKYPEIKIIPGNIATIGIFGKKAKNGVIHLKTAKFIDNQKKVLDDLFDEIKSDRVETTLFVINGIPFDREQFKLKLANLTYDVVEEIKILEDNRTFSNHKRIIIIQTNKLI